MRNRLLIASLLVTASISFATDRATLTGRVTDNLGQPLQNATVMVYHAGVKTGYSVYCPSCYRDCGKRTETDRTGSFTIQNVDSDLWFELLVVRDGYTAAFVERVDPSHGPVEAAALAPRARVDDPGRVVRGRVVDQHGRPLRAAVVEPKAVAAVAGAQSYGDKIPGLEPIAVTNSRGEFELSYREKATGMLLQVEARGMATKLIAVPTGAGRETITVSDGALIRGRLVNHGKPVAGAEVGLIAQNRGGFNLRLNAVVGNPYDEIRIGTQDDGSFVIPNVPTPADWYVYGKMEAISALGSAEPLKCTTRRDREEVDVGDIQIIPGHRLRGRITLSDGAAIADGMHVTIYTEPVGDTQTAVIGHDGHFEFANLPTGKYTITPAVRGYRVQPIEATIEKDIDDFAIVLDPAGSR